MALTVLDYMEGDASPNVEVARVQSTAATGDIFFSRKFSKILGHEVQNHGATFASGVVRDPPKLVITQGSSTTNAKVEIQHTATTEVFSLILYGEL